MAYADDFVDNVFAGASRVAKCRGNSMFDVRDVALVLERDYNIRIPGYTTEELRTVRKITPTAAWTQKVAAVQAAKLTGGKPDQ